MTTTPTTTQPVVARRRHRSGAAPGAVATGCSAACRWPPGSWCWRSWPASRLFLVWSRRSPRCGSTPPTSSPRPQWLPDNTPPAFGIAALAFGTLVSSIDRDGCSPSRSGYGIALFLAHYAPKRVAAALAFVVDLLAAVPSIIFGLWGLAWLMPRHRRAVRLAERLPRLDPALPERPGRVHPLHRARRHRAGDHDPADRLRDQPRGVRPGAAGAHRGRARARRDPLGDGPDGGLPVQPGRDDQRGDARPGPGAGRDDRGRADAVRRPSTSTGTSPSRAATPSRRTSR